MRIMMLVWERGRAALVAAILVEVVKGLLSHLG